MEKRHRLRGRILAVLASVFTLAAMYIGTAAMYARPDFPEEVTEKHIALVLTFVLWTVAVTFSVWSFFSFARTWEGKPLTLRDGQVNVERLGCLAPAIIFLALVALAVAIDYTHY